MTLAELIKKSVNNFSNNIFLVDKGDYTKKEYTYKEIYEKALKIANYFKENNIAKGDKVITFMPNCSDYVSVIWACALSGVILIPLDINSQTSFLEKIYNASKTKRVFCSVYKASPKTKNILIEEMDKIYDNYSPKNNSVKIKSSDIFEIVYTSGTTSEPKGVILTQENLYENVLSMIDSITHSTRNMSMLSVLPLSHLLEQNIGLFNAVYLGTKVTYISSKKTSKIIEAIKEERINTIVAVPLFLEIFKQKILNEFKNKKIENIEDKNILIRKFLYYKIREKLYPLKTYIVGGSALNIDTEKFWKTAGFRVLQGYGLTETSPVLSCNSSKENKDGSAGKPLKNVEIIIENGEILTRGKNVFKGYYNNPEETKKVFENGWFKTGDLGKLDKENYLFLTGRKKNVIISPSGLNIYPEDIEKVLNSYEAITSSVVMGLNNGKDLTAAVIAKNKINPEIFKINVNTKLSDSQKLTRIIVWPEKDFPRTPTMKILRNKVEEYVKTNKYEDTNSNSEDKLTNLIATICKKNPDNINEKTKLTECGLDSIKRIELVTKIEEIFNTEFNEENINETTTIHTLRNSIKQSNTNKSKSEIGFLNSLVFSPIRFILQEFSFIGLSIFYRTKIIGRENLPEEKCILIANHVSMLDTFVVYKSLPMNYRLTTCPAAAKDFFFENKFLGFMAKMIFNAFGFSRKGNITQSMKDLGKLLDKNNRILIYPEGTRSRTGKLAEFKEGIGVIARETNLPLVPIKIDGLHKILPVGSYWPRFGKVEVKIGKPLKFNKMQSPIGITKILHDKIASM